MRTVIIQELAFDLTRPLVHHQRAGSFVAMRCAAADRIAGLTSELDHWCSVQSSGTHVALKGFVSHASEAVDGKYRLSFPIRVIDSATATTPVFVKWPLPLSCAVRHAMPRLCF